MTRFEITSKSFENQDPMRMLGMAIIKQAVKDFQSTPKLRYVKCKSAAGETKQYPFFELSPKDIEDAKQFLFSRRLHDVCETYELEFNESELKMFQELEI